MERVWLKSYPAGVNPAPVIPRRAIAALIRERCAEFADREAFWSEGRSLSFGEVYADASAFAAWLLATGLRPGERVAVMLPNVLAFPVADFGAILAGAIVVNVNPMYTARELAHQLADAGARTLVAWEPVLPVIEKAAPGLDRLVVVSPSTYTGAGASSLPPSPGGPPPERWTLEAVLVRGRELPAPPPLAADPARPVFLQYTGGTTGLSKGAVLTEQNVNASITQQLACVEPFLPAGFALRGIAALPLYHIAALMAGMFRFLATGGAGILIANPRHLDELVEVMARQRFTVMGGVNTLYNALLNHPRIGEVDFSHCRYCAAGATATQQVVVDRWQALTGMSIVEGYGLTETCCHVSQAPFDRRPFNGSVGLPMPLTDVSIRDPQGNEVALGEAGEVCVRGPQVMAGYWQRPADTAAAMTPDGYLRTGDIGALDTDGYLRLSDRKKDMILVSGFNVFPNELEGVLLTHPKVLEAAVVAVPDAHSGEVPAAFVVKRDASLTVAELEAHCAEYLTAYKRPRHFEFRASLPKSPVGKILRRALREETALRASVGGSVPP